MKYNIIRPDDMGYKDRGKLKWEGLMLSDHVDALKKLKDPEELIEHEPKEEQDEQTISEHLYYAYVNKLPITIQADVVNKHGNYYRDVSCIVVGQGANIIYLYLKDKRKAKCPIDKIRNVEFMDPVDWYDKMK